MPSSGTRRTTSRAGSDFIRGRPVGSTREPMSAGAMRATSCSSVGMPTATDVFVSDLLQSRHPSFHAELSKQLARFGIVLREISGTRDIWCRDYMPVPIGEGRFVQFIYKPDYLADLPELITMPEVSLQVVGTCRRSKLVVDGGNVVRRGRVAIVTEKVFAENSTLSRS